VQVKQITVAVVKEERKPKFRRGGRISGQGLSGYVDVSDPGCGVRGLINDLATAAQCGIVAKRIKTIVMMLGRRM
jgi:hypothetical protein